MPSSARCTNFREGRPAAAQREAIQYDNHPDEVGTICHGTAVTGIAESPSVPEGQVKSALALIHRPPVQRGGTNVPERVKAIFSLPPGAAHSLFGQDQKENGGRTPHGQCPLAGARPPWPPFGSPHASPGDTPCKMEVIPPLSPPPGGSMPPGHRPRRIPCGAGHW